MQGSHRARLVMEFAIIIVFDDAGARGFGKPQEFEAAADRHQPPGRVLVRRRDEDQPGRFLVRGNGHAVLVERDGGDDGAGGPESDVGAAVARAFDPGAVARFEQRIGDQHQAGLRRGHEQDLTGFSLDPAMNREMPEQGFLQRADG